jgi:hypothetical protein
MVAAVCDQFDEVVSVELDPALYRFATERHAGRDNVQLLRGDSAELLPKIIAALDEPALFWLDAHYSEGITARSGVDTPIETELRTILATDQPDHVVLIDDAREFVGANDYPTLAEVERFVSEVRPGWICQVADDVIRIHPPRS